MPNVTCGIPTKNRYDTLLLTLQAIAFQTHREIDVIIVDDSDQPVDLRTLPAYRSVFELFNAHKINFQVEFGQKRGQHHSHQRIQELAKTEFIWRIDDDEIPEPNALERLLSTITKHEKCGAVGGLVLPPNPSEVPDNAANLISDLNLPNVQWYRHPTWRTLEVEHLHSTFLYRRGIEKFNLDLSPAAHREESLFTHGILRKGYKLLVDTGAITWHFRSNHGGIRSHTDGEFWTHDEQIFSTKLKEWGINSPTTKVAVLDAGKGDHVIFRKLIPDLQKKYEKVIVASCFPDVFENTGIDQISIAQAKQMMPIDHLNIYRKMIDWKWGKSIEKAFRKLYDIEGA